MNHNRKTDIFYIKGNQAIRKDTNGNTSCFAGDEINPVINLNQYGDEVVLYYKDGKVVSQNITRGTRQIIQHGYESPNHFANNSFKSVETGKLTEFESIIGRYLLLGICVSVFLWISYTAITTIDTSKWHDIENEMLPSIIATLLIIGVVGYVCKTVYEAIDDGLGWFVRIFLLLAAFIFFFGYCIKG